MKRKNKFIYFILSVFIIFVSIHGIQGKVSSKGISVGYNAKQEKLYEMSVVVIGDGYISDNGFKIQEYTMKYQLKDGDTKTFKIHEHSRLNHIVFNEKDITDSVDFNNEIKVMGKNHDSVLVVSFEAKQSDPEVVEKPALPKPTPPNRPSVEKPIEKEIITTIIKDIQFKDIGDVIDEDFLRKYIISSSEYKILSHNVQKKAGTYEIVVQLSDGSIRTLEINVLDEEEEEEVNVVHINEQCNIHLMILSLLILFIIYSLYMYHHNYKKIKTIEKYAIPQTTSKTRDHVYLLTAIILQVVMTYLFISNNCSLDMYIYLFSSITVICLVVIAQLQQRSYLNILNCYK